MWRGAGAHAGQHSMIDFVLVSKGLPARECQLAGRMPVRTDEWLLVVAISGGGGGGRPAPPGVLPTPAQVAHRQVLEHQWERLAKECETWSSTWEPHPDFSPQEWVARTLQIICEAVGHPIGTADIQVHNDVWSTLMARKRQSAASQGFDREMGQKSRPVDSEMPGGVSGGGRGGSLPGFRRSVMGGARCVHGSTYCRRYRGTWKPSRASREGSSWTRQSAPPGCTTP